MRPPARQTIIGTMRERLAWIVGLAAVAVLIVISFTILNSVQNVTEPMGTLSSDLGTQVAQVLHPTPTILPDPVTVVRQIRTLARLETIQYSVEKVITAQTGQGPFGFLFGDRLLLVAHGNVTAGVDLSRLRPQDVGVNELGQISVDLPPAEVFTTALDNHKTYVYDRQTGLLTKGDIQLESEARAAAEDAIRQAALDDGILDQANTNARAVLQTFLGTVGFHDVVIRTAVSAPAVSPAITPTSPQ